MDNTNFLKSFDELIKNSNGVLKITLNDNYECGRNGDRDKSNPVSSRNGFVYWNINSDVDTIETLTDNLLKVESLIDDAIKIKRYDEETRKNHPDIFVAIRARINNP